MAQAEDTELRDLVIEALERNGSLAKIRALLRANLFLAFEDDCEKKQNAILDNILKQPEGILALSVIHEFLEFCCLKNTLFVYMAESRQGNDYNYDGKKALADEFNISKSDTSMEPTLLTLIKKLKPYQNTSYKLNSKSYDRHDSKSYREEQNCTYILNENSPTNSTHNCDNSSSDEKNKLHLRLQLDTSDTDTSSDSSREVSRSVYVPNDHILKVNDSNTYSSLLRSNDCVDGKHHVSFAQERPERDTSQLCNELKLVSSGSESTVYMELKPFNSIDAKMLNTAGLPIVNRDTNPVTNLSTHDSNKQVDNDLTSLDTALKHAESFQPPSPTMANTNNVENSLKKSSNSKSDGETDDFSYGDDFSLSPVSKLKDVTEERGDAAKKGQFNQKLSNENTLQTTASSPSSASLSDITDLISEKSSLSNSNNKSIQSVSNHSREKVDVKSNKLHSNDSGDFSDSPILSLSNLSVESEAHEIISVNVSPYHS